MIKKMTIIIFLLYEIILSPHLLTLPLCLKVHDKHELEFQQRIIVNIVNRNTFSRAVRINFLCNQNKSVILISYF